MSYAGISEDKINVRKNFEHKINVLENGYERMNLFEFDRNNKNISYIDGSGPSGAVHYRCKEHQLSCFSVEPYWNLVHIMTKITDTADEHVDYVKTMYGFNIEKYELVETLREVDNYDPFTIYRPTVLRSQTKTRSIENELEHDIFSSEEDEDNDDENDGPCHECLRKLYRKIPQRFSPTQTSCVQALTPAKTSCVQALRPPTGGLVLDLPVLRPPAKTPCVQALNIFSMFRGMERESIASAGAGGGR